MEKKDDQKQFEEEFHCCEGVDLRTILQNAIRMQALYSGRKIKIIETSTSLN